MKLAVTLQTTYRSKQLPHSLMICEKKTLNVCCFLATVPEQFNLLTEHSKYLIKLDLQQA